LAKAPKQRFGGCQAMANALPVPEELRENLGGPKPHIPRPGTPRNIWLRSLLKRTFSHKFLILVIIVGIGLFAVVIAVRDFIAIRPPPSQCGTVREIARGSIEQMYSCAVTFYSKGRLSDAQLLWEEAWRVGQHGPSSLAIGKMYDPVLWGQAPTPFTKPDAYQAKKWYQRAAERNVEAARDSLRDLEEWNRRKKAYP
jgi:hypothetical protein